MHTNRLSIAVWEVALLLLLVKRICDDVKSLPLCFKDETSCFFDDVDEACVNVETVDEHSSFIELSVINLEQRNKINK